MKTNSIPWLRTCYWAGAVLDLIAAVTMLFPALFLAVNHPAGFNPGVDYRYAMGMGAPLMIGWTVLLLWADRKPLERRGILPITLLAVAGEVAVQIWGISAGFVPLQALLPAFGIQAALTALFIFGYFFSGKDR
jgi:hypothetical protein